MVERTGLDEGYLDLTPLAPDFGRARSLAEAVRTSVRAATSLSCSLGVAPTKVVAKVASDRRKPGGITVVPAGTEAAFLAPFPVRVLPGVGPRAEERLAAAGVATIGGLGALSDLDLRAILPGQVGRLLRDRALGIDPRGLELTSERISISVEETFERDLHAREPLHAELRRMALEVAGYLERDGLSARTVTTKLRYADFSIRSRSTSLPVGIDDAERIGELACSLLDRGLTRPPGRAAAGGRRRLGPERPPPAHPRGNGLGQQLDELVVARSGREVGGRLAVVRRRGRVCAALDEHLDALAVAVLRGGVERREAAALAGVRVGAVLEQQLDDQAVATCRRAVQRRDLELGVPRNRVRVGAVARATAEPRPPDRSTQRDGAP